MVRLCQVSRCVVQIVQKRCQETGTFSRQQGSGRKRKTTEGNDELIGVSVLRNRSFIAVQGQFSLRNV